jgi:hypothetical protein
MANALRKDIVFENRLARYKMSAILEMVTLGVRLK